MYSDDFTTEKVPTTEYDLFAYRLYPGPDYPGNILPEGKCISSGHEKHYRY